MSPSVSTISATGDGEKKLNTRGGGHDFHVTVAQLPRDENLMLVWKDEKEKAQEKAHQRN